MNHEGKACADVGAVLKAQRLQISAILCYWCHMSMLTAGWFLQDMDVEDCLLKDLTTDFRSLISPGEADFGCDDG